MRRGARHDRDVKVRAATKLAVSVLALTAGLVLVTFDPVSHALAPPAGASTPASPPPGYWLEAGDGGVFAFGAPFYGSAASEPARCPANPPARAMPDGSCWSMAPTPDGGGYWILNAYDGAVFAYGDAVSYGQPADTGAYAGPADLWPDALSIAATPDGKGYWVLELGLSGLGSVQAFGDATDYGDQVTLFHATGVVGRPVAIAATPDGKGYWIADSDGGVFAFGDAAFHGSMGGRALAAPVVGMAAAPDGGGYWLAGSDGGVFAFGDAAFHGSMGGLPLARPVFSISAAPAR